MAITLVIDLAARSLNMILLLAGPLLATALTVGLAISVVPAVTSIQEQTLSFVPKLFAVGGVLLALLGWMINQMLRFTHELFVSIPSLVG